MILKYLSSLLIIVFFTSCSSTSFYVVNSMAKLGDYEKIEDISFNKYNSLDIYVPTIKKKNLPVIVFFYGGCWGACQNTDKQDYEFLADALTERGYVVVIPDYRYYPKGDFATIISDAADATQWVKQNIQDYNGDNNNIFLMGHSAGAHIAIMLNAKDYLKDETYSSIRGAIGLSGPYDFIPYEESGLPKLEKIFGLQNEAFYSQPANFIDGNEPAFFLAWGEKDTIVHKKSIVNLSNKINEKDGKVKTIYYKDLDHSGLMTAFTRLLRDEKNIDDLTNFMESNIKSK